jgi:hypothetical protein
MVFWWRNLLESGHLEDKRIRWGINIRMDLRVVLFEIGGTWNEFSIVSKNALS